MPLQGQILKPNTRGEASYDDNVLRLFRRSGRRFGTARVTHTKKVFCDTDIGTYVGP
jgi:hypothetical protein